MLFDLEELTVEYEAAFAVKDHGAIGEVVSKLNAASPAERPTLLPLYQRIYSECFSVNLKLPNLDLVSFKKGTDVPRKKTVRPPLKPIDPPLVATAPSEPNVIPSAEDVFVEFYNFNGDLFTRLKDYYIFAFETDESSGPMVKTIVCDSQSKNNPLLTEFQDVGRNPVPVRSIDEFLAEKLKADNAFDQSLLIVLCITPTMGGSGIEERLKQLFSLGYEIRRLRLHSVDTPLGSSSITSEAQNIRTIDEIKNSADKTFANQDLPYEVQRIIKQYFEAPGIINYRVLAQGYSGASVFEVQHLRTDLTTPRRFVVKIAAKQTSDSGEESKLQKEKRNFNTFVQQTPVDVYSAERIETETLEAIFYNYASKDGVRDSESFHTLLNSFLDSKNPKKISHTRLQKTIKRLLECQIVGVWNRPLPISGSVADIFALHLSSESEVVDRISEILLPDELEETDLLHNLEKIKRLPLETNQKICHGDLHSQNFFDDGEVVILIDFGMTGTNQALVDHAFLEASIRLRHFPLYIPVSELLTYDEHFLSVDSFGAGFNLDFIPEERSKLRDLYSLIVQIRNDSTKYFREHAAPTEYLIALFVILFRLIQYPTLNQRYALRLSEQLGKQLTS